MSATTFFGPVRSALLITMLLACASSARAWTVTMVDNRRYVPIEEVADFYKMAQPVSNGGSFRMTAQGRSIEGRSGTSEILINGVKYVLCFGIETQGGKTLISAMDIVKIIEPIMRPQKIQHATAIRTVVLDAGHGGQDSGARGDFGAEKDAALDVVLKARALLMAAGYQVKCTRTTDVFIPLEDRVAFANRYQDAIFISVHFNKSDAGGGTGLETYCLAPRGVPSMDEANLRYSDLQQWPGHARDPENVALATTVHAALVRALGITDRGIKRARFLVIKNITIPGILVEGGFMSGALDARLIATQDYRSRMAQCIVDGVNRYKQAVSGVPTYQKPTVVVAATDPTSAPELDKPAPQPVAAAPVGSKTDDDRAVGQARSALEGMSGFGGN